ncbi:MAG: bifunctional riboflavin kinase/FMN adenylyltransferase [Clostridia bacterium]|nr:bifunctional riboflavin kinase/FMN adenylyltransferase [Clostridia bacterium]
MKETDDTQRMTVLDLQNNNIQLHEDEIRALSTATALGCFDGVHIGHAALLQKACSLARETDTAPAVWTFLNPPFPGRAKQLTPLSEKLALFASHDIRYAMLFDFADVRNYEPEPFVREILVGACHTRACVCGFNFRFAKNASGTPDDLHYALSAHGAALHVLPPVQWDGAPVSATRIRAFLASGDVASAAYCLGRYHALSLPVVHGKELGRTIGVPTINQNPTDALQLPANGTYATAVTIDGISYPSVTNIGIRPSVTGDDHIPNAETHIIGYRGWLYDRPVTVVFRRRLRDEIRFPSLDALKAQITCDIRASVDTFERDIALFQIHEKE